MKKVFNIVIIIFCLFFVAGCSDEDSSSVKLAIVNVDLDMKASGGIGTVEFISTGTVTATVNADWCKVSDITDNKVTVSVETNTGYPSRSAQLVLTDGISTQQATILQEGAVWIYDKADTEVRVGDEAGEFPVIMSSSLLIEVDIPETALDWLSYKLTDKGFNFIVKKNETGEVRGTFVTVKTGERNAIYTVLQYDAVDLLGEWGGAAYMMGMGLDGVYGFSPNPSITANEDSGYTLTLPMVNIFGGSLTLNMIYNQGIFLVPIPQLQNFKMGGFFASIVGADQQSYYFSPKTLAIAPVLLEDGSMALTCITDAYFMMGLFTTRTPSNESFTKDAIEFPIIQLYR